MLANVYPETQLLCIILCLALLTKTAAFHTHAHTHTQPASDPQVYSTSSCVSPILPCGCCYYNSNCSACAVVYLALPL